MVAWMDPAQRWSRVFEPAQGPQKKQVYYTDCCRLQHYFGKISKRHTLNFSRYRPSGSIKLKFGFAGLRPALN